MTNKKGSACCKFKRNHIQKIKSILSAQQTNFHNKYQKSELYNQNSLKFAPVFRITPFQFSMQQMKIVWHNSLFHNDNHLTATTQPEIKNLITIFNSIFMYLSVNSELLLDLLDSLDSVIYHFK